VKRWRIPLLLTAALVVVVLAFLLQDVVNEAILVPLAYLWWLVKFYYTAIPQLFLWIGLLVLLIFIISGTLAKGFSPVRRKQEATRAIEGQVESLAGWIAKTGQGNYYKWRIANRLGLLACEIVSRSGQEKPRPGRERLEGPDWDPPVRVRRYLEAGLNESFVDYPQPALPIFPKPATPFDLDPNEVVGFLESHMEASSERRHP